MYFILLLLGNKVEISLGKKVLLGFTFLYIFGAIKSAIMKSNCALVPQHFSNLDRIYTRHGGR